MKSKYLLPLGAALCSLFTAVNPVFAQGTAFTYQGRLTDNGSPANGNYDLQFYLRDAPTAGNPAGTTNTLAPVPVSNGLFTVTLDFGAGVFTGPARWLEIGARTNGSVAAYSILNPRQALTPSPYAIFATTSGTASNVVNGSVVKSLNGLKDIVTLAAGSNVTISPSGNTLTIASAGAGGSGIWSVLNNNAYYTAGNVGIGTSTPAHRLSLAGGPSWTTHGWVGAVALPNAAALGWQANSAGQRFGMGHTDTGFYLFRTASNPGTTASPPIYDFVVDDSGNVGIGTTTPTAGYKLEIAGSTLLRPGNGTVQFGSPNAELGMSMTPNLGNRADVRFNGTTLKLLAGVGVGPPPAENGIVISTAGNVGIGSPNPTAKLEVVAQDALRLIGYQPFLTLSDANAGYARSRIQCAGGEMILASESYLNGNDGNAYVKLANSGNLSVKTLTIRGGADVAEPFELTTSDIAKGSVVVIDPENPGKLKLSDQPYDKRVAGVVSGANGVNPGISLHQEGALAGGENVALSGRVYVQADAASGAIQPGDLLTTSDTPGHAMKVANHGKAQGAILGKAMSGLKEGKGMVLILVTLQ